MVERVENKIAKALMSIIAMGLFSLTVLAVLQVVTRYFVDVTIIWIEEVSIYILSWMAAAGVPWMWLKEGHIRMDVLNVYLPQTILYGMDLFINLMEYGVPLGEVVKEFSDGAFQDMEQMLNRWEQYAKEAGCSV